MRWAGAGRGSRTPTRGEPRRILSPLRLPVPPSRPLFHLSTSVLFRPQDTAIAGSNSLCDNLVTVSVDRKAHMKIGILGAGNIGAAAARLFVAAGHEVALSNSRGPESLRRLVTELGPRAHATSIADAPSFGDVVLLAVPWRTPEALPAPE